MANAWIKRRVGRTIPSAIALLTACVSADPDTARGELVLTRETLQALPAGFDLAGAAVNSRGGVVAWSRTEPRLLVIDGASTRVLDHPSLFAPVGARLDEAGGSVTAIDPSALRVVTLDAAGTRVIREQFIRGFASSHTIQEATPSARGWLLVSTSREGDVRVDRWREGERSERIWSTTPSTSDSATTAAGGRRVFAREGVDGEVLIAIASHPYEVTVVARDGASRTMRPGVGSDARDTVTRQNVVSLAALPVENGYLQVLADLASQRRTLVRYSREGVVVARRDLTMALGFVASVPRQRQLLSLERDGGRFLLGSYRWSWR